ncbi:hypothetical protein LRF89_12570 [Halorhodospira sp. 9621]|uniref:hypothetical protein n=1 Tax=Halorhodospira sp. 9621 TaxID=2899135 RepID=UPI001EE7934F|nr:hypothetical protein [Halorhodospira sp. 9621]MCG5534269.1 hypothetical protein [Halorhodospira sp. 9621]
MKTARLEIHDVQEVSVQKIYCPVEPNRRLCPIDAREWVPKNIGMLLRVPIPVARYRDRYYVLQESDWVKIAALRKAGFSDEALCCLVVGGITKTAMETIYETSSELLVAAAPRYPAHSLAEHLRSKQEPHGIRALERGFGFAPGALAKSKIRKEWRDESGLRG